MCLVALCQLGLVFKRSQGADAPCMPESEPLLVGRWREDVIVTPVNQLLTPYGKQVELPGIRPQAILSRPTEKY